MVVRGTFNQIVHITKEDLDRDLIREEVIDLIRLLDQEEDPKIITIRENHQNQNLTINRIPKIDKIQGLNQIDLIVKGNNNSNMMIIKLQTVIKNNKINKVKNLTVKVKIKKEKVKAEVKVEVDLLAVATAAVIVNRKRVAQVDHDI